MIDNYKKHDPKGWMGDPSRGAAMGRPYICALKPDYSGYIYVREVVLDDGGYDCLGTYFGGSGQLWWCYVESGDLYLDMVLRGNAETTTVELKKKFPNARVCFAPEKIE